MVVKGLDAGSTYRAYFFDPRTGKAYDLGMITGNLEGSYIVPKPPIFQDWVLVLEDVIG